MLFIHGDADTFVPTWMVYPLYEAKPEPKELWIVPGATHAMSYKDYPQEYTEHVKKFVGNTYIDVIFPIFAATNIGSMRRFISIASFLCLLLSLQAQEVYTTKNIPKVHLQDKTRYVCNPAGILSTEACDNIDRMLYALEQQTGIETVVAVVPSIGQEDCFDFSHQLLNEWGVGKKRKTTVWSFCW